MYAELNMILVLPDMARYKDMETANLRIEILSYNKSGVAIFDPYIGDNFIKQPINILYQGGFCHDITIIYKFINK